MKRLIPPNTILWRLAGLTTFSLAISFVCVVLLFGYTRQELVAAQVAENAADILSDLEDTLDGLPIWKQHAWVAQQSRPYAIHLVALNNPDIPAKSETPTRLSRAIVSHMHEKLVATGEIRQRSTPKAQLWVRVDMLGEPYWMVIPLGRSQESPTWEFAASAAFFMLAALASASLFALWINKPLRQLTNAAAKLGRGEHPPPLPEQGPREVRHLSASFNRMLADLQSSEAERSVMLAGISHDLRTPLARMKLGIELMADEYLREGMRQDVEDIEHILTQFINFARGDTGEEAHLVNLCELATGVAERYKRAGRNIQLDLSKDLPLINIKPLAMQRALTNLLDNACKYGRDPIGLSATIENNQIRLAVTDRGEGIPGASISDATKPFHRLDAGRRADGGSGLGLAIVERIARIHQGKLQLCNRKGGGLEAAILLPLDLDIAKEQ